jgi:isocitrate/isopropylmalate dehydrogenase
MHLHVLAGDGIGPEITAATLAVLRAASADIGGKLGTRETGEALASRLAAA